MGLIDRFNQIVSRLRPQPGRTTSDEVAPPPSSPTRTVEVFRVYRDRRSKVLDCRKMYDEDPRAETLINTLARDAVTGGFTVTVTGGSLASQAQETAERVIDELDLFTTLDDWVRLSLRDGDSFLENSVDDEGWIVAVTRKPTLEMHRNANRFDGFDDPRRAYWWSDQVWYGERPPQEALWFADWQIIHARWGHDQGSKYGKPLFSSGRKQYKRMDEGESDIAIRRKTRAGMKYVHKVDGNREKVEEYREINKDTLDDPLAAIQDFFGNVEIEAIQGDARLAEIGDVIHHVETWAVASPVPLALIGYGKDLNRDILEQKLEQYEDALPSVSQWVTDELVKPLLEIQWLLQGIWPDGLEYSINWANKKTLTPERLQQIGLAGAALRGLGWPDEIIVEILAPLIAGLDKDRLLAAIVEQEARMPDEIGRIAGGVRG